MNPYLSGMIKVAFEQERKPMTAGELVGLGALAGTMSGGLLYMGGERHPAWLASAAAVPATLAVLKARAPRPEQRVPVSSSAMLGASLGGLAGGVMPALLNRTPVSLPRTAASMLGGAAVVGGMGYLANRSSRRAYGE